MSYPRGFFKDNNPKTFEEIFKMIYQIHNSSKGDDFKKGLVKELVSAAANNGVMFPGNKLIKDKNIIYDALLDHSIFLVAHQSMKNVSTPNPSVGHEISLFNSKIYDKVNENPLVKTLSSLTKTTIYELLDKYLFRSAEQYHAEQQEAFKELEKYEDDRRGNILGINNY